MLKMQLAFHNTEDSSMVPLFLRFLCLELVSFKKNLIFCSCLLLLWLCSCLQWVILTGQLPYCATPMYKVLLFLMPRKTDLLSWGLVTALLHHMLYTESQLWKESTEDSVWSSRVSLCSWLRLYTASVPLIHCTRSIWANCRKLIGGGWEGRSTCHLCLKWYTGDLVHTSVVGKIHVKYLRTNQKVQHQAKFCF